MARREELDLWRRLVRRRLDERNATGEWEDYIALFLRDDEPGSILDSLEAAGVIDADGILTPAGRQAASWLMT